LIDFFCRLSAKTREKIMASVEISLPQQLCSHGLPPTRFGIFSEKSVHRIWESGATNDPGSSLSLHDTSCPFLERILAHRRLECTHAVQIIDRNLITQDLE
jgi:hypothetical protein